MGACCRWFGGEGVRVKNLDSVGEEVVVGDFGVVGREVGILVVVVAVVDGRCGVCVVGWYRGKNSRIQG